VIDIGPLDIRPVAMAAGFDVPVEPGGVTKWGTALPCRDPGVYVISLDSDASSVAAALPVAPISPIAVDQLIERRAALTIDGHRPTANDLIARIGRFWLPDEVVLYIGLAGTSLADRVDAY
jgi:hypothetical protein